MTENHHGENIRINNTFSGPISSESAKILTDQRALQTSEKIGGICPGRNIGDSPQTKVFISSENLD